MQNKFILLLSIIVCFTLILAIVQSRKKSLRRGHKPVAKMFTLRGILILAVVILFLFFSLIR